MRFNKFTYNLFINRLFGLILCVTAILCVSQLVSAQSGRRTPQPNPTPTPKVETKTPNSAEEDPPPERITSLILTGETQDDSAYSKSNYADSALKECLAYLEFFPKLTAKVSKGGQMSLKEAKERAAKETDAYVLWMVFVSKSDGYINQNVAYVEYIVLKPKTGKKLTSGRITPESLARQRSIIGLPKTSKRSSEIHQINEFARAVMDVLIHGGWLTS
jgi:hypothetical protein